MIFKWSYFIIFNVCLSFTNYILKKKLMEENYHKLQKIRKNNSLIIVKPVNGLTSWKYFNAFRLLM